MRVVDITGSRAKLIRADEHLKVLGDDISEFSRTKDAKVARITYGRDGAWHVIYLNPIPALPLHTALVAGDCLNNIRAALDHLVWQLVLREDQEPQQTNSFPICATAKEFREKCITPAQRKQKRHLLEGISPNGPAWAIIERAQPFNSAEPEKDALLILNNLTKIDKHRTVLVQRSYITCGILASRIRWSADLQPIEQRFATNALSTKQPTEIARFRFADGVEPNLDTDMNVEGGLPIDPCISDGKTQVSLGILNVALRRSHEILDKVAALPGVQETALQSAFIPEYTGK